MKHYGINLYNVKDVENATSAVIKQFTANPIPYTFSHVSAITMALKEKFGNMINISRSIKKKEYEESKLSAYYRITGKDTTTTGPIMYNCIVVYTADDETRTVTIDKIKVYKTAKILKPNKATLIKIK